MFNYISKIIFIIFISLFGTLTGTTIGIAMKNITRELLSIVMGIAGGIMLSIIAFDLIPSAIVNIGFYKFIIYFIIGVVIILVMNSFFTTGDEVGKFKRVGLLVILALSIHNFPEGLIIGCSMGMGTSFGIKTSFIISLHDIPEGIAAAVPFIASKERKTRIVFYSILSAAPTILGALIGIMLGEISNSIIGKLFSLVSGIMSYIVFYEMIPSAYEMNDKKTAFIGSIIGIIIGIFIIMFF